MCGICGYARPDTSTRPPVDPSVLMTMTARLTHRGPDAEGLLIRDGVALGHRRLAVVDIDHGRQPMRWEPDDLSVVYNGELYDFDALNQELAGLGLPPTRRSDTETLLRAYAAWGDGCVHRFNGMFAFVIYDARRRRLFGARDHMGKKPLSYRLSPDGLVFSSEVKSLVAHPDVDPSLDLESMARFFVHDHVPAPHSIYAGICTLPPAHRFSYDLTNGRLVVERYWDLPTCDEGSKGDDEWIDELESALVGAVRRRLVADVPVGVFLSGGVDSSTIAAIAREQVSGELATFSIGVTDPRFDETTHARRVARLLGTRHHELMVTPTDVVDHLPQLIEHMDEPFADPSIIPTTLLARMTRHSVTVALSGDGGDELLAGYQTFKALAAARLYDAVLPRWAHERVMTRLGNSMPARYGNFSLDFKVQRFLRGLKVPPHQRLWRWIGGMTPEEIATLFTPDVLRSVDPSLLHEPWRIVAGEVAGGDDVRRDTHLYTRTYLPDGILTKLDRATMSASLEARCPLLDRSVVELAARMPSRLKFRRGSTKWILRRVARRRLPADIVNRPKQGFALPIGAWLRGPLRSELLDVLDPRRIRDAGLFRPETITRLLREHLDGRRDHRKPLFALFIFERWRRRWLESTRTAPCALAA